MATFQKRGTAWRAEVRLQGIRKSATFRTKAQAKAWADELEYEIKYAEPRFTHQEGLVKDLLARYRDERSPLKKGYKWESNRLSAIIRDPLARIRIADIQRGDLASYRDRRALAVANSTVNRELNLLSAVFTVAIDEWHALPENPCRGLRRPRNPAPRDRRISDTEISQICRQASYSEKTPVDNKSQQVALAFLFAIETGMRLGEIMALEWSNIFLEKKYLNLETSKNNDSRDVPLTPEARRLLQRRHGYPRPFEVNENSASSLFRKMRDRAGIKNLTFHDTRHEAVSRLARKLSILDLARMIGHRDLKSLQIYYNATPEEIASAFD